MRAYIGAMKQLIAPVFALMLLGAPALAQEAPERLVPPESAPELAPEAGDIDEGVDLLQEGARLLFRGLIDEMGPALEEMQDGLSDMAEELGPALRDLRALIDDLGNYSAPERLPNGDIVIRRKPGAPPPGPPVVPEDAPEGEIEL